MAKRATVYVLSVTDGSGWWVYGVYENRYMATRDGGAFRDRSLYGEDRDWKIEEVEVIPRT